MQIGLRLERMPAQDMLDVLHYLFESDAIGEEEEQDAKHQAAAHPLHPALRAPLHLEGGSGQPAHAGGQEFGTQEVARLGGPGS